MCDEIAIINHGELVARDSTANLLGRLDTRTLVIDPAGPIPALPDLDGIPTETRPEGSLALTYHAREKDAGDVLDALRTAGLRIRDIRTEQADLEDVFLDLTSGR